MSLPPILRDTRLYPLWVGLVCAAILLLRLGSYGFWEPHEISVADRANEIAHPEIADQQTDAKKPAAKKPAAKKPAAKKPARKQTRSELSAELVAKAITTSGRGEGSSRAPLALLALLTIIAVYFIGLRLAGPRAGLFSAAIMIAFPAVLMHGRHLTSEIGSAAGSSLVVLGLLGLLSRRGFGFRKPAADRPGSYPIVLYAIDGLLVVAGALLCYRAAGAFLGVLPPFAGVGLAAAIFVFAAKGRAERARVAIAAAIGIGIAVIAFGVFFADVFELVDPDEINAANEEKIKKGARIPTAEGYVLLGGNDVDIEPEYPEALAGMWRKHGDRRVGFSTTLESIAIGTFPWIAVIPIALVVLLIGRGREESAGRTAIVLWALAAYVVGAIFERKVGTAMYPAWGALAAAAGVWLADVFAKDRGSIDGTDATDDTEDRDGRNETGALPLIAFFVVCAAVVVGKDILAFPEKLTSFNLASGTLAFPKGVTSQLVWVVVGWAAIFGLAVALATRDATASGSSRIAMIIDRVKIIAQRGGLWVALGLGVLSAVVFAQVLTPELSSKLSSKNILGVYQDLRAEGDVLGIMGRASGASYYAGTDFEKVRGRNQLLAFLERPERVFALAPASERCPLNKAARKKGLDYHVVDDSSAQFLLFSNKLKDGETDVNPLKRTFFSELPEGIRKPLKWDLDGRIELVGVSMPDTVRKGTTFKMKLYFKVIKPLSRNWKVFVHFDTGVRFQADHDPIGGTCGTTHWLPGDYVIDEFEVTAGSRTHPAGTYKVWLGLFVGSSGNYTNMKIVTPGADPNNRIPIGNLTLK